MEDGITPRLWYLSEVGKGYHRKGENFPSILELHPHGRCYLTTLIEGFGFNSKGKVTYKKKGYSEIKRQRGEE